MKIAVTFDNGEIFQHFGHTEQFKIYQVEDGKIISSEVVGSNGNGHGALAGYLNEGEIKTLICGGIGGGAINALSSYGIEVVPGQVGDADTAVNAYLKGEIVANQAPNCNHHGEGHTCGDHDHGECGNHGCH